MSRQRDANGLLIYDNNENCFRKTPRNAMNKIPVIRPTLYWSRFKYLRTNVEGLRGVSYAVFEEALWIQKRLIDRNIYWFYARQLFVYVIAFAIKALWNKFFG